MRGSGRSSTRNCNTGTTRKSALVADAAPHMSSPDVEGVFSPHQHLLRRFGQLQNGCCCDRISSPVCVGRVEMKLPNRSDTLAVQNGQRELLDVYLARVHAATLLRMRVKIERP